MSNRARIREEARKLNPIDDLMFRKMAEDVQFCQEILRVILSDKIDSIGNGCTVYRNKPKRTFCDSGCQMCTWG